VVSSKDYGGTAKLKATLTITSQIEGLNFGATSPWQARVDAQGGPFANASLPVDRDQDGMADSWEQANGGNLEPSMDSEPGKSGGTMTPPAGDGITAFDEYRGFHILDQSDLEGVEHVRTNPLTKQTVFYWDSNSPQFHNALHRILAPRTLSFIEFFPVNQQQAHVPSLERPIEPITSNSLNNTSLSYALAFVNQGLSGCTLGLGLPLKTVPVWISLQNISDCAEEWDFPEDVLLASTVAHESGHKFGLEHPTRIANHAVHDLLTLPLDMYTRSFVDARQLYVRYRIYSHSSGNQVAETVRPDSMNLAGLLVVREDPLSVKATPDSTFVVTMSGPLSTGSDSIEIFKQEGFLMDWTPLLTLGTDSQWDFSSTQYMKLRVKP
jgi:hypothetical protein